MTQNLALEGPKTLTAANSNVFADFNLLAPTSSDTTWCTTNDSACNDQSMSMDSGNTDYGFYYNWYAATAGTGTYSVSSGNAESSICPKGWRLPTGDSSSEFNTLYTSYGSTPANIQAGTDPNFVLSGYRVGGSTSNQGNYGDYWSSTAYGSNSAYNLGLNSSSVNPASYYNKYGGFSVRCVADDSAPGTLTVTPSTIDADTATTVDVSIPLSGDYNANISLGDTALTCSRTSTSPLSFSCNVPSTTSGTYTLTASLPSYGKTYTASITVNPSLSGMCSATSVGSTFTYSGVEYIKLKTNPDGTTSACYTKTSQGIATWNNTTSLCPANTDVPTQAEFQSLINAYGSDDIIYNTTGWEGNYWSSTQFPTFTSTAYLLTVTSSWAAATRNDNKTNSLNVVCIVR